MNLYDPEVRAAIVAALCLALWLTEVAPAFVPTLLLLAALPLCGHSVAQGLTWMADPVLALFFGSFVLGEACAVHGIDRIIVGAASRSAGGSARLLLILVVAATAFLSMWMSNVAAPALMLAALRPVLASAADNVRRALLVGIAVGANLGGMATPIGTGPNAVAMAHLDPAPTFLGWMLFAVPLTVAALVVAVVVITLRHGVGPGASTVAPEVLSATADQHPRVVALVAAAAVATWLSEPLHGIPAAAVSLTAAGVLFGTGLVPRKQLGHIDWSTLLLIAGGIGTGRLLEQAGWIERLAQVLTGAQASPTLLLAAVVGTTALLSAVMSNTATATLLVPIVAALYPSRPGLAILVALAASFGMPFAISTPANAMVIGAGARSRDLLVPGVLLMVGGCVALVVTGPAVLAFFGY